MNVEATSRELPALVPARMLNEFVYCPRLFYLEWVDGLFEESEDTVEGSIVHERSNRPAGRMPESTHEPGWEGISRAVTLDAPQLGIVARLDLVEGDGGSVIPVEYKKGSPQNDGSPWEADAIQVAAQVLVLQENGYQCSRGVLGYRATRTRVNVDVDSALESRVRAVVARLRETAQAQIAPPPLRDSPKCPRCSLVGICLPDETNAVAATPANDVTRPRRLVASDPDARPLYVQEPGARVGLDHGRLVVHRDGEELASLRMLDVSEVALFGGSSISEPALRRLARSGVPVTHFSFGGWLDAITVGVEPNNVGLRIEQFRCADDRERSLAFARAFVNGKVRNQRVLLRRNGGEDLQGTVRELERFARLSAQASETSQLLGLEGAASRDFYRGLATLLEPRGSFGSTDLSFERRSRRPPRDRVNAVLSFLYALLVREAIVALRRVGFDPLLGFYHRPRFGRPALALDLMEEFRPLIADSTLLLLVNGGRLSTGDFVERAGAVSLTASGRKATIHAFELRMQTEIIHPQFRYRVSYRRALELQARLLAGVLRGELPKYRPLVTR